MTKTLKYAAATVAASAMVLAYASPALAAVNSTSITIHTVNSGSIKSVTQSNADTGLNTAGGSTGGNGGNGGDVLGGGGSENNGGALAGNGGNGGNGGAGGFVVTGNASADSGSDNELNGTNAEVDFTCACGDVNSTTLDVSTDNSSSANHIDSFTDTTGRTGRNTADGSTGGTGGSGGTVDGSGGSENNGGAKAGTGGAGGAGGLGGEIRTGNASSTSGSINLLNTTIIRVHF